MRTGTVLHGPREGEIFTADSCTLLLPEPSPDLTTTCDGGACLAPTFTQRRYRVRVDDDGRGWWVEDRVFGNLS
jgi:hypothetical protein